jgi:hypothetical protein
LGTGRRTGGRARYGQQDVVPVREGDLDVRADAVTA